MGNLVFGEEDDELEDVVLGCSPSGGPTLATVESGTPGVAGPLADGVRAQLGHRYRGGVAPARSRQRPFAAWLRRCGQPGRPAGARREQAVAEGLVTVARERFGSDYALAIGEFPSVSADKGSGDKDAPVPPRPLNSFFALATPRKAMVRSSTLASHPSIWRTPGRQTGAESAALAARQAGLSCSPCQSNAARAVPRPISRESIAPSALLS